MTKSKVIIRKVRTVKQGELIGETREELMEEMRIRFDGFVCGSKYGCYPIYKSFKLLVTDSKNKETIKIKQ